MSDVRESFAFTCAPVQYTAMPWRRPDPRPPVPLDHATLHELARMLAERLETVKTYGGNAWDAMMRRRTPREVARAGAG